MTTIILADDHAIVRLGVRELLAEYPEFEIVGMAPDGETAVRLAEQLSPDLVLMDISMPGIGGIKAIEQLTRSHPQSRVLAFTAAEDRGHVLDAIDAGAVGYVVKGASVDELTRALRSAARGEFPLAPQASAALIAARRAQRETLELSEREREVLQCIARGMSNKEIARSLEISEKTVKGHLTSVFRRIGVQDRTQAALWAQEHGIFSPP